MSLKIKDVIDYMEIIAPKTYAMEWDQVGLQVGSPKKAVERIMITLEINLDVLKEATNKSVDLIISHHPLIFKPLDRIDFEDPKGAMIQKIIQEDLHVYVSHTNMDVAPAGLNHYIAEKIGLNKIEVLCPLEIPLKNVGLGRIGELSGTRSMKSFIQDLKKSLQLNELRYVGDLHREIFKVAILNGSGGDFIKQAKKAGADCFITGDVKYHEAQDAMDEEMAILDIGHYESEIIFPEFIKKQLNNRFGEELEIYVAGNLKNPFHIL